VWAAVKHKGVKIVIKSKVGKREEGRNNSGSDYIYKFTT
jgi:hypothetical protein